MGPFFGIYSLNVPFTGHLPMSCFWLSGSLWMMEFTLMASPTNHLLLTHSIQAFNSDLSADFMLFIPNCPLNSATACPNCTSNSTSLKLIASSSPQICLFFLIPLVDWTTSSPQARSRNQGNHALTRKDNASWTPWLHHLWIVWTPPFHLQDHSFNSSSDHSLLVPK